MIFEPHSQKQEDAIDCDKSILILGAGTQWGKTRVGAVRMKQKMHEFTDSDDAFIITAPNYKTLYQSTLPAFLKIMEGWGTYNKKDETFRMHNGGVCYCRTETDPDSIVGITNVRHVWGDEAGKYGLYFWENMQARADSKGCAIDLTTSPYSLNWVYKDLIRPTLDGKRKDVLFVKAASWENPYHSFFDPVKKAAKKATMDPRRFDMLYGGEWGQMEGLVYDCWDDQENLVEPIRLPNGTEFYGGIDWGYTEPFVLTIRAVTPSNDHYQVFEFYKTGKTIPDLMEMCKQQMQIFGVKRFFSGHERPENIELFNQNRIPTEGVPEKDIMVGTHLHYELIKTRRYKVFKGTSPYTLDETASYHYPEPDDLKPDQDSKELTPVGQNDHAMSANRFITLKTHRSGQRKAPFVPGENGQVEGQARRLARLMKLKQSLA